MHLYNRHVRRVKTVKIVADNDLGFVIINEIDFNPERDQLYDDPGPVGTAEPLDMPDLPKKSARVRKPKGKKS